MKSRTVLYAGGAWTSGSCRHHGLDFPQSGIRATSLRTTPAPTFLDAFHTPGISMTRRLDGGYTLAISGRGPLEFTPQGFRYARNFLPMFVKRLKAIEFGISSSFCKGLETLGRWSLDRETPFEQILILDPAPSHRAVAELLRRARNLYPQLADVEVAQGWARSGSSDVPPPPGNPCRSGRRHQQDILRDADDCRRTHRQPRHNLPC